jgi:N6-adenosine-specific RNA methylase IME4
MLHAKIEKVANTMPKRGILFWLKIEIFAQNLNFFLKNQIFCSKFIEIMNLFFSLKNVQQWGKKSKNVTAWQKVQKRGKFHVFVAM